MNACTVSGWFWHCDLHDTHGNADSEKEAWFVASAHARFFYLDEGCDLSIVQVKNRTTA